LITSARPQARPADPTERGNDVLAADNCLGRPFDPAYGSSIPITLEAAPAAARIASTIFA
jgi:hypothetical protein